jgi:hypothetical protein
MEANLTFSSAVREGRPEMLLQDESAGFAITCAAIRVDHNVDPIY